MMSLNCNQIAALSVAYKFAQHLQDYTYRPVDQQERKIFLSHQNTSTTYEEKILIGIRVNEFSAGPLQNFLIAGFREQAFIFLELGQFQRLELCLKRFSEVFSSPLRYEDLYSIFVVYRFIFSLWYGANISEESSVDSPQNSNNAVVAVFQEPVSCRVAEEQRFQSEAPLIVESVTSVTDPGDCRLDCERAQLVGCATLKEELLDNNFLDDSVDCGVNPSQELAYFSCDNRIVLNVRRWFNVRFDPIWFDQIFIIFSLLQVRVSGLLCLINVLVQILSELQVLYRIVKSFRRITRILIGFVKLFVSENEKEGQNDTCVHWCEGYVRVMPCHSIVVFRRCRKECRDAFKVP